jgi:hypothetical protein
MPIPIVVPIVIAVVSVTVTVFREDIRNFFNFSARRENEYLRGVWECTWDTLVPSAPARPQIKDTVTITRVSGNLVKAVGNTTGFGAWDLNGRVAHLAVSFSYTGRGGHQHLPGAIVLKKVNNNSMSGAWAQYTDSADVISGTTEWRRT